MRYGTKYHGGPVRLSAPVVRRCAVSVTSTYRRKSGTSREIAQTHGAMTITNATKPAIDARMRGRRRQLAYGMATMSGTASATGPLVMTPNPIAIQARVGFSR